MIVRIFLSLLFITIYSTPLLPLQRYKPVNIKIESYNLSQVEMRRMKLVKQMCTMTPAKVKMLAFQEEDGYTPLGRLLLSPNVVCLLPVTVVASIIYYFII